MTPDALLEIRGVSVRSDETGRLLLRGIDVTVAPGERVALLGESGAGKTILLRALAGVLPSGLRMAGHVSRQEGAGVGARAPIGGHPAFATKVTMVPQIAASALPPLVTVPEFIASVLHWSTEGRRETSDWARVAEVLERAGLSPELVRAKRSHQLSGGMAKRVAMAAALATSASVLLLDEPTAGLDPIGRSALIALLKHASEVDGVSLVVATHDPVVTWQLCESAVVLRGGVLIAQGRLSELAHSSDRYVRVLVGHGLEMEPEPSGEIEKRPGGQATRPSVISLRDVWVEHRQEPGRKPGVPRLREVSLEIRSGDRLGVVGRSGAGKTTLALVSAGLLRPSRGTLVRQGRVHSSTDTSEAGSIRVQMVFQNPFAALNPRRTIGKWLELAHRRCVENGHESGLSPRSSLEMVGLGPGVLGSFPGELSGGECQRIGVAVAAVSGADLLILDEPASMLDPIARATLIEVVDTAIRENEMTLMVVSHDLDLVASLCGRIAVLSDGAIVEEGDVQVVLSEPRCLATRELVNANGGVWSGGLLGLRD
jgi:peptide/nickel transport system ATP-binding protein